MRRLAIATGALVALAAPAPAHAWSIDTYGSFSAGPALAGDATVWAETVSLTTLAVRRSVAGETPTEVLTLPRTASCDRIEDLAASAQLVAVEVSRTAGGSSCDSVGDELMVTAPGGPRRIEGTSAECMPAGFDVDAGLLAVTQFCSDQPVVVHDVAAGTVTAIPFTVEDKFNFPRAVRIAGRYVAFKPGANGFDSPGTEVILWDRVENREVYRVDSRTLAQPGDEVSGTHFELQADGRLLVGIRMPGSEFSVHRWGWASVGDPTLRALAGVYTPPLFGRASFVGDLAAVPQSNRTGGVVSLSGQLLNRFTRTMVDASIDFDGARLAWSEGRVVHSEPYPYEPPAQQPGPGFTPPAPGGSRPVTRGSAPVGRAAAVASKRAKALKAFSGTAADADGDLALVRVGLVRMAGKRCESLQQNGRLARVKRTRGACVPTVWLSASGTAKWKLKLRRRLPAGRYSLYVQAVDAAGHAQVTFTKPLGSLRAFTLK